MNIILTYSKRGFKPNENSDTISSVVFHCLLVNNQHIAGHVKNSCNLSSSVQS